MMIQTLRYIFKNDVLEQYPRAWSVVGEIFFPLMSLTVYWYTAKAFVPNFSTSLGGSTSTYFSYLVIGELVLYIPLFIFSGLIRAVRTATIDGTFDALLVMPLSSQIPILILGLSQVLRGLITVFSTLFLAICVFGLRLAPEALLGVTALIVVSLPIYFGLGLVASSFLVMFGRGSGVFNYFTTLASILSGAYFPISVLPEWVQKASYFLSPFSYLLETSRALVAGSSMSLDLLLTSALRLGLAGFWFFLLGYMGWGLSIRVYKEKGAPLLLRA